LSLQCNSDPDVSDEMFISSQSRIQSMALVHEQLYQAKSLSSINLYNYIDSLVMRLFSIYHVSSSYIEFKLEGDEVALPIEITTPIALIVNEVVSNSLKYAFHGREHGHIVISITDLHEQCRIQIADNGIGFEYDENSSSNSLGLDLIKNLTLQLQGSSTFFK